MPLANLDSPTLVNAGNEMAAEVASLYPFFIMLAGLIVVIGGIVVLKLNAFISLIAAAIVVSVMSPGPWGEKMTSVMQGFGDTAKGVGILIALASIIGMAMVESGAADRVVRKLLGWFGEDRAATALMSGGFVLAMPVFFDTVFYLMVPLARSLYQKLGKNYLKFLLAIGCCATAHALVPPTPGPLLAADTLKVSVGMMMFVGCLVGFPAAIAGMAFASFADSRMPNLKPPASADLSGSTDDATAHAPIPDNELPSLGLSMLPILLPIVLISMTSFYPLLPTWLLERIPDPSVIDFIGNPTFTLFLATLIAMWTYWNFRKPTVNQFSANVETALMSGGVIVLITCAGGAFGKMLKNAQIAEAISAQFGDTSATGMGLLLLSFGVAALVKFAQGSSTTALIVTSSMIAAIVYPDIVNQPAVDAATKSKELGYHPAYLAAAIGAGSLVGSWMNDSGFWIFAKMGGLTETEGLKTWTPLLAILGIVAMLMTLLFANVLPMVSV